MADNSLIYTPGTILLFSSGEYSDYGYCGQVVVLTTLDLRKAIADWREALGKDEDGDWVADDWDHGQDAFVAHLICTQQVAPLECQTVHIGSYGRVEA